MRSPHLYDTLRRFCLGAFAAFHQDLDTGADLPFAFEEHGSYGRPTLYEYRPLVRGFIEARAERLFARDDVRQAVDDLLREPAARIFARAHEGVTPDEARALYRSVLVPLLVRTARRLRRLRLGRLRVRPLVRGARGVALSAKATRTAPSRRSSASRAARRSSSAAASACAPRRRASSPRCGPRRSGLLPRDFGREPDRLCVLELERSLDKGADEAPDAPGELADAVTALRLATAAPVAAGPVLFERLDWRPYGIRPVLPIAATAPPGEPTRLDPFRASVAEKLRPHARARRRRRAASATRSTAGSSRSSRTTRSAASSCGTRSTPRSATARESGPRRCAPPPCSARRRRSAPTSSSASGRRRRISCAGCSSPSSCTATAPALLRELDGALLGLRAGRDRVAELRAS